MSKKSLPVAVRTPIVMPREDEPRKNPLPSIEFELSFIPLPARAKPRPEPLRRAIQFSRRLK